MSVKSLPDSEQLLDRVVEAEVLSFLDEELAVTGSFQKEIERSADRVDELDSDELRETVASATGSTAEADTLLEVSEKVPAIVPEYLALIHQTDLSHTERLRTLPFLDRLIESPRTEGVPEAFVPVSGERLPFYAALHNTAIVYVWREECPPCDRVREIFDDIFDDPPDDMALLSVYGPDSATKLHEWYDIVGGPATVFFYQGSPEARMYGAYERSTFEKEIERHRNIE